MTNITIPKNFTGELVAIPQKEYNLFNAFFSFIDKEQMFFWTKEWQTKEKEADEAIKSGKVSIAYNTKNELKKALALLKK
jgi:hypothetical protein